MVKPELPVGSDPIKHSKVMSLFGARYLAVLLGVALLGLGTSAQAQGSNPDQKPPEKGQPTGDAAKAEAGKKRSDFMADFIAEAGRKLTGPAANAECVWVGYRVIRLLSQDDLDTAFRHLDIYDRFGCPGNHIQATFRCLVKVGIPDGKTQAPDGLDPRVRDCWLDPAMQAPAPGAAPPASAPAAPNGAAAR